MAGSEIVQGGDILIIDTDIINVFLLLKVQKYNWKYLWTVVLKYFKSYLTKENKNYHLLFKKETLKICFNVPQLIFAFYSGFSHDF